MNNNDKNNNLTKYIFVISFVQILISSLSL